MRRAARRFRSVLLSFVPPDCKDEVRQVLDLGRELHRLEGGQKGNDIYVFLALVRHAKSDWEGAVKILEEGPPK